jgi:galactoside O-acetyltransferase
MKTKFLTEKDFKKYGINKFGSNCSISSDLRVYGNDCVIGSNVRIDDNVILKGKIRLKNNVHLSRGVTISSGANGVFLDDFAALSNFVQIFGKSDDYFKPFIPGATLDYKKKKKYSFIHDSKVVIGKCVLVGAFAIILPGAEIEDFSSIAAYSMVIKKVKKGVFFNGNNFTEKKRNVIEMNKKLKELKKIL